MRRYSRFGNCGESAEYFVIVRLFRGRVKDKRSQSKRVGSCFLAPTFPEAWVRITLAFAAGFRPFRLGPEFSAFSRKAAHSRRSGTMLTGSNSVRRSSPLV